ncbi:MAG TPA: hypothetical protein VGM88_31465 [Kofleriaceae bacterium]|jgi:hypothetical protein
MSLTADVYGPEADEPAPPEARRWEFFLTRGIRPVCTFVRRREGAAWTPPRIVVSYPDASPPLPPDPVIPWDARLEDWLVSHGVVASDEANEAERFGFDLVARMTVHEARCGLKEFTAALLRFLFEQDNPAYARLEKSLGAIRPFDPDAELAAKPPCCGIKQVMTDTKSAVASLGYDEAHTRAICDRALTYYLRERFSI